MRTSNTSKIQNMIQHLVQIKLECNLNDVFGMMSTVCKIVSTYMCDFVRKPLSSLRLCRLDVVDQPKGDHDIELKKQVLLTSI